VKITPQLQRESSFKNTASRLAEKFSLNGKFVASSPQSPTLSSKEGPQEAFSFGV
jgi:hypothetical protein